MTNLDLRAIGVGGRGGPDDFADLSVVVLGGLVMDVFVRTRALPEWGQAIQAERVELQPGGKGFNQAVAASRLGARVCVVGAVGADPFGSRILNELIEYGIDVDSVKVEPGASTPVTIVFSRPGGDTSFVGWKNAKEVRVDKRLIAELEPSIFFGADVLLSTLEVSPEAVVAAQRIARKGGCLTVLNPAPPLETPGYQVADLHLDTVDVLIPNEWEARELAGRRGDQKRSVRDVAMLLSNMGASAVCVTRAHNGCCFVRKDTRTYREYEAYEADVDDTTGASDAFCAALALHLRAGYETEEAIHQAQAAGAFAVRRQGAGRHMPTKGELDVHRSYLESTSGG